MEYPQYITYNGTVVKLEKDKATQVQNDEINPKISCHTNVGLITIFNAKIGDENHSCTREQFVTELTGAITTLQNQNPSE